MSGEGEYSNRTLTSDTDSCCSTTLVGKIVVIEIVYINMSLNIHSTDVCSWLSW